MRLLIYAINGKGMGHLNRTTILAKAARRAEPQVEISFLAGSPLYGLIADGGFEVVKVPDRHHPLGFFSGMNQRPVHFARLFKQLIEHYRPHVFVTDFALNAALFSDAKRLGAKVAVVLRKQRPRDLRRLVLTPCVRQVDRFLLPHEPAEWALEELPRSLRARAVHLGKVVRSIDADQAPRVREKYASVQERLVVVTIGGGGYEEAHPLLEVGAAAAAHYPVDAQGRRVRWLLVYGPYYPFEVPPSDERVVRVRYEASMPELLLAADVVVCNAGYNTIGEVESCGTPAVIVPRQTQGRDDQVERARSFVADNRGLSCELSPEAVAAAAASILDGGMVVRSPLTGGTDGNYLGETFLDAVR